MQVIYADILFFINVYVTYALLLLTGIITKSTAGRLRLLLASLLSGVYSLIIFLPSINDITISLTRIPACVIIVASAYKLYNLRHFLRLVAGFLGMNFAFAGLMFALWYFAAPNGMYFNSGVVYFNIDTATLLVLTAVCYIILKAARKLIATKAPSNTIYDLKIHACDGVYFCKAFLDTGNSLKDHFTGYPVIIVYKEVLKELLPCNVFDENAISSSKLKIRFIVCSGVSGSALLPCFRPEKVIVKSLEKSVETNNAIIAVTENKIKNGAFSALLPGDIFLNNMQERGDYYDKRTVPNSEKKVKHLFL